MLSDKAVKAAAAREKRYTMGDGNGLVLEVRPGGQKYWLSRTWEGGKERKKSLGRYPEMSLKEAREANILYRRSGKGESTGTFAALAEEWMQRRLEVSEGHMKTIMLRMEKYIVPAIGAKPLDEITPMDVLNACRAAEDSGFLETAHRVRGIIGQVFRYGVASGRCSQNPAEPLRGALKPYKETSYPTLTDKARIRALIAGIDAYPQPVMQYALKFSLLTFARPGEIRNAEWSEIEGDLWTIPAEKMKMKRVHTVPLCPQALETLDALLLLTGDSRYLFPSARDRKRPMSDGGVRTAIRAMGFAKEEFTAHSFRSLASTVLNENGFPADIIEKQLAHEDENRIRAAYNRSEYLDQRREMMRWWGEWVAELLK
jgi:integrase